MRWPGLVGVAAFVLGATACTTVHVRSKSYLTSLDYARPDPGAFVYVKRNITTAVTWDSHQTALRRGGPAHRAKLGSLLVRALKQLLCRAGLQDNQALYNVRISAPRIDDQFLAYYYFGFAHWKKSHYAVSITADVIEFTRAAGPRG